MGISTQRKTIEHCKHNDRCEAYCSSHKLIDNHIGLHILVYDLFNKHKNNNESARNKTYNWAHQPIHYINSSGGDISTM